MIKKSIICLILAITLGLFSVTKFDYKGFSKFSLLQDSGSFRISLFRDLNKPAKDYNKNVTYTNNAVKNILDATVSVRVYRRVGLLQGVESGGSGLVVSNKKGVFVFTNYHVVDGDLQKIEIKNKDNTWDDSLSIGEATILAHNESLDLAILKVVKGADNFKSSINFYNSNDLPPVGSPVYHAGNMRYLNFNVETLTKGIISRYIDVRKSASVIGAFSPFIETDAGMYYGSSGGGLFLQNGQCIGITSRIWGRSHLESAFSDRKSTVPVLGYAIPYFVILDWAKENNLEYTLFPDPQ